MLIILKITSTQPRNLPTLKIQSKQQPTDRETTAIINSLGKYEYELFIIQKEIQYLSCTA